MSFLQVSTASGALLVDKAFQIDDFIQPLFDQSLAPGTYSIHSWQQPCNGNCGSLDARSNECMEDVTLESGDELFVTASFAPGRDACSLRATPRPPSSPIPDAVALRMEYRACGEDDGPPRPVPEPFERLVAPARECFAVANQNAEEAELTGFETSPRDEGTLDRVIYRTRADRSIDVFKRLNQREPLWQHYTCTGLIATEDAALTLADCTEPATL